jgi:hypothetical protein
LDGRPGTLNFQLYLNNGDGTFTDVGALGHPALGHGEGRGWGDLDNDGGRTSTSRCSMAEPSVPEPGTGSARARCLRRDRAGRGGGAKGELHHLVLRLRQRRLAGHLRHRLLRHPAEHGARRARTKDSAVGERPRLYHNNRDGTFTDVSKQVGSIKLLLTMGANYGDLDNDGWRTSTSAPARRR